MVFIFGFLSFQRYVFCWKISLEAWQKSLMSTRKKYVYLCYLDFFSKCSIRWEWYVTVGGKPKPLAWVRSMGSLSPLHTPCLVMRLYIIKEVFPYFLMEVSYFSIFWPHLLALLNFLIIAFQNVLVAYMEMFICFRFPWLCGCLSIWVINPKTWTLLID